jgi:hypothetical protein
MLATASAPLLPANQASRTAETLSSQGSDGGARFQHHDGARVGGGDLGDECVLIVGERKVRQIPSFGGPLRREDDGDIGFFGELGGSGGIFAGIEGHRCAGNLSADRF